MVIPPSQTPRRVWRVLHLKKETVSCKTESVTFFHGREVVNRNIQLVHLGEVGASIDDVSDIFRILELLLQLVCIWGLVFYETSFGPTFPPLSADVIYDNPFGVTADKFFHR